MIILVIIFDDLLFKKKGPMIVKYANLFDLVVLAFLWKTGSLG